MPDFTPLSSVIGGGLIGLAAVALLKLNGRIAGISGIVNGVFKIRADDRWWRMLFLLGLVIGATVYQFASGKPLVLRQGFSMGLLVMAGLLVGFGTRLGSGCTSGHGVCGIARLSPRSVVATVTFLGSGMVTASAVYLWSGVAS